MPMSRATRLLPLSLGVVLVYLLCLLKYIRLPKAIGEEIIPLLPLWAVVTFGSYALATLGWGVFTFNDTEEAYHELKAEIQQAKAELRSKGVSMDS